MDVVGGLGAKRGIDVGRVAREAAAPPSLVVIVASSRAEQQRLLAAVPEDVTVLLAPGAAQARAVLGTMSTPMPTAMSAPMSTPVPPPMSTAESCAPPMTVRAQERTVVFGDRAVRLTPLEFAVLRVLASDVHHVWSFEELSRLVWATGHVGDGAQVRAVVKRLRRKLAEAEAPVAIETVRATGFRLVTEVAGSRHATATSPQVPPVGLLG